VKVNNNKKKKNTQYEYTMKEGPFTALDFARPASQPKTNQSEQHKSTNPATTHHAHFRYLTFALIGVSKYTAAVCFRINSAIAGGEHGCSGKLRLTPTCLPCLTKSKI
jgi:hypothetical protein